MSDAAVQAVFDKVIDAGIYPEEPYMCVALDKAETAGVIDGHECELAYNAIQEYLGPFVTMRGAAEARAGRGRATFEGKTPQWAHSEGVHFYRNWADRPGVRNADS